MNENQALSLWSYSDKKKEKKKRSKKSCMVILSDWIKVSEPNTDFKDIKQGYKINVKCSMQ